MHIAIERRAVKAPALLGHRTLHALLRKTLHATGRRSEVVAVSVAFIDIRRSREVNERYRRKRGPTDVLSFGFSLLPNEGAERQAQYVGEILLCPTIIRKRAKLHKRTVRNETIRLFVHGLLHLLGYDHTHAHDQKKMFAAERRILGAALLAGDDERE